MRVLGGAGFSDPVVDQVRDLERWLADFPAGSMLELDYGTVADHFPDGDLTFDESASDVRESLEALERGDGEASRMAYARVAPRWAAVRRSPSRTESGGGDLAISDVGMLRLPAKGPQ